MRGGKGLSITKKLTLVITATSCVTLVLATAAYVAYSFAALRAGIIRELETTAQIAGDSGAAALTFGDSAFAEQILNALRAKPNVVGAEFYTSGGALLAAYRRDGSGAPRRPQGAGPAGVSREGDHLVVARPVVVDGETLGMIRVESHLTGAVEVLATLLPAVGLVLGLSMLLAWSLSRRLQRVVSDPLLRLADATRSVSKDRDYTVRVPVGGNDEVGLLSRAFNEMLTEIETREVALRQARDDLERRVEIRTVELRREVNDRQKAQEALRQSETALRQSQKMEAIGRLAGGVAHDFNNILTAISGYSQLTLARLDPRDPLRKNVQEVYKASQRAASLTQQLLAFSRKQVLAPKVIDLNEVVGGLEPMLQRLIGEDVFLTCEQSTEAVRCFADPGQIEQVIMNLVVNARDAMVRGGTITLAASRVLMDDKAVASRQPMERGEYVALTVTDTGCGMDEATRARIFEPFFTTKAKGTGLGLATVYGIVKQSGGYIWVDSEPGRGTTFTVHFPRVEAAVERAATGTARGGVRGTETILLVEDDDLIRDLAGEILRLAGYSVIEASDGGEAVRLCERRDGTIDLMLSDVVMPHMNGRELHERVRSLRPTMKVLFMSGYTAGAIEDRGVLDPETEFIQKPFTPDELTRKVRQVLDRANRAVGKPANVVVGGES